GYLRRNPNDTPDTDYTGYDFWLTKLNQFGGNFQKAEMVKAFFHSGESRRHGQSLHHVGRIPATIRYAVKAPGLSETRTATEGWPFCLPSMVSLDMSSVCRHYRAGRANPEFCGITFGQGVHQLLVEIVVTGGDRRSDTFVVHLA